MPGFKEVIDGEEHHERDEGDDVDHHRDDRAHRRLGHQRGQQKTKTLTNF